MSARWHVSVAMVFLFIGGFFLKMEMLVAAGFLFGSAFTHLWTVVMGWTPFVSAPEAGADRRET